MEGLCSNWQKNVVSFQGLVRLLEHHTKLLEENYSTMDPLIVIGPGLLYNWLSGYSKIAARFVFRFISCHKVCHAHGRYSSLKDALLPNIKELTTVEVDHGTLAYGITFKHQSGWSMTYSGDTMPSENLIAAGKDSTFLIHEATLEDGMEEEAKEKHHSTLSQALDVAAKMKATCTMLTHFSQRYPKLPVVNNSIKSSVALAFDHMEISLEDFSRIPSILPKLEKLFEDNSNESTK